MQKSDAKKRPKCNRIFGCLVQQWMFCCMHRHAWLIFWYWCASPMRKRIFILKGLVWGSIILICVDRTYRFFSDSFLFSTHFFLSLSLSYTEYRLLFWVAHIFWLVAFICALKLPLSSFVLIEHSLAIQQFLFAFLWLLRNHLHVCRNCVCPGLSLRNNFHPVDHYKTDRHRGMEKKQLTENRIFLNTIWCLL